MCALKPCSHIHHSFLISSCLLCKILILIHPENLILPFPDRDPKQQRSCHSQHTTAFSVAKKIIKFCPTDLAEPDLTSKEQFQG